MKTIKSKVLPFIATNSAENLIMIAARIHSCVFEILNKPSRRVENGAYYIRDSRWKEVETVQDRRSLDEDADWEIFYAQ